MNPRIDRRTLLVGVGVGAASGILGARARAASTADVAALSKRFRETPRDAVLDVAAKAIAAGADRATVLGAIFLAGVEDIRPHPVGNFLHNVMTIESMLVLTEDAPAVDGWLAALWVLDDFKAAQADDAQRGDWVLPSPPSPKDPASPKETDGELAAALEAFDPDRADRALTALFRRAGVDDIFEILWPFAARSFTDAGHRIIHSAQIERTIRQVDSICTLPALRTIVLGLADDAQGPATESFTEARAMAKEIPDNWLSGSDSPSRSPEVLRALRGKTPKESQAAIVEAFREGLGAVAVWDGIRLYASELMLLRPVRDHHFPVHSVTEVEAFGHAWSRTKNVATKKLLVLQAAAWTAMVREAVIKSEGAYLTARGIDLLGRHASGFDYVEGVEKRSPDDVSAALATSPLLIPEYMGILRGHLVRKGDQNHQFKYAGSILEESRRGNAYWHPKYLAVAVDYLPGSSAPETELYRRSMHALKSAGVV